MDYPLNATNELISPSLMRRLAAILYDALLITALWMMTGGLLMFINNNQIIESPLLPLLLPVLIFVFFTKFWMSNGQTLGMQTWKIKLVSIDESPVSLKQSAIRLIGATVSWACLGLGYWWAIFDKDRLAWHDRWSDTRLVIVTPQIEQR